MASAAQGYYGNGFSPRGEKDRYVLPGDFRAAVLTASANQPILCLDTHHQLPCLVGFGLSRADGFADQISHEERIALERGEPFDREERGAQLYGFVRSKFDDSGRFILPDYLGEAISVDKALYFHGGGSHFTIWAPDVLYTMGPGWDNAKRKCRKLIADAPIRGKRA